MKLKIPVTYIGDMPRKLASTSEWRPLSVRKEEVQCGDLLFVKNIKNPKLLSHIAMFIDTHSIFHCNPEDQTAVIHGWSRFFSRYIQHLNFRKAVRYIDPRNQQKRAQEKDIFIQ